MKLMLGIAAGKWVMSYDWIAACVESRRWVGEAPFEIQGDQNSDMLEGPTRARKVHETNGALVLKGYSFVLHGQFAHPAPSRAEVEALLHAAGGTAVKLEELAAAGTQASDTAVVLCDTPHCKVPPDVAGRCRAGAATAVHLKWLLDSISAYRAMPTKGYRTVS
jgi:hypothetical protein